MLPRLVLVRTENTYKMLVDRREGLYKLSNYVERKNGNMVRSIKYIFTGGKKKVRFAGITQSSKISSQILQRCTLTAVT